MSTLKIISGGQTGVDQAALSAAKILGLETGGYIPHNYMTSSGPNFDLAKYGLVTLDPKYPLHQAYAIRNKMNVEASHATLIFSFKASRGTDLTKKLCIGKPHIIITALDVENFNKLIEFLKNHSISILNVAGHRDLEYFIPVQHFLVAALSHVKL